MLEVVNLTKKYKPKKGVPVLAVDHINLKFPEKGMVFLLGKSGSGKSTTLNLLGGLDVCDEGEIIIKGKSSRDFKQKDFDSYRNTYLGFIFQEYNILEEFNVGANIALALELQGQKATDEKINQILEAVDLEGYGARKPNELSGGQKQRVAIARALVKDPEIILADEPTGALDSNTGRQILDTLKKLSKDKLVIVVSHDREFAENYADRIVELADGHVISDMEYEDTTSPANAAGLGFVDNRETSAGPESASAPTIQFVGDSILLPEKYHLTEEDRLAINAWMDNHSGAASITRSANFASGSGEGKTEETVPTISGGNGRIAKPTDQNKITFSEKSAFNLIKSKLPLKNAFRIGVSGLKHKKFRLVITILLSCVAFGLFGVADTMGSYNHVKTCTESIMDSDITYASFCKSEYVKYDEANGYWQSGKKMTEDELNQIAEDTGLTFCEVYTPIGYDGYFDSQYDGSKNEFMTDYTVYSDYINGFAEVDQDYLDAMNMTLMAGRLPDGNADEIAITKYVAQSFVLGGYREYGSKGRYESVESPTQMVGKTLNLNGVNYEIVGIVDTGFDFDHYEPLTEDASEDSGLSSIVKYALSNELSSEREYSLIDMGLVGSGFIDRLAASQVKCAELYDNCYVSYYHSTKDNYYSLDPQYLTTLDNVKSDDIVWLDGEKQELTEKDIVVAEDMLRTYLNIWDDRDLTDEELASIPEADFEGYKWNYNSGNEDENKIADVNVVGYIPDETNIPDDLAVVCQDIYDLYADDNGGTYQMAIGAMPTSESGIKALVKYAKEDRGGYRYDLENSVTYELDELDTSFKILAKVFLWIGIGFAIFASIMMATFISSSISYKKQEIGILRAIGARGSDVFRIFFSESFVIAMINFVLSSAGCKIVTMLINRTLRMRTGLYVTVLHFGIRQIALLLVVSIAVAALASFFPVNHNARKKPIDAIRNR